jgi:hypothetical protein
MSAERRGPAICNVSNIGEGKDEMTTASIDLRDLRRRIYVEAKAEPSWHFWGLYVHVCRMETLRAVYEKAKRNDGAPGIDGVTFEAIEAQGVEALLERLRDELIGRTYQPLPARRQEIPKDGAKSVSSRFQGSRVRARDHQYVADQLAAEFVLPICVGRGGARLWGLAPSVDKVRKIGRLINPAIFIRNGDA